MWSKFAKAMLNGEKEKAKNIMKEMTNKDEIDAAKRWLNGPNAKEKKESKERQKAIEQVSIKDIIENCQIVTNR